MLEYVQNWILIFIHDDVTLNRLLQHPNIVQLLGYTLSDTELVLVMNLVEGNSLHKLLFGKLLIKVRYTVVHLQQIINKIILHIYCIDI